MCLRDLHVGSSLTVFALLSGFLCDFLEGHDRRCSRRNAASVDCLWIWPFFGRYDNAHDAVCLIGNRRASSLLLQLLHLSPCHPSRLGSCWALCFAVVGVLSPTATDTSFTPSRMPGNCVCVISVSSLPLGTFGSFNVLALLIDLHQPRCWRG